MTLYALLVAAVVLPCVYVAITAISDYRARVSSASEAVARNARIAEEHALKVFDLNVTLNERIVDLLDDLDADAIRHQDGVVHTRLSQLIGSYHQVAAASVFGPDGQLLATSRAWPTPDVTASGREDFAGVRADSRLAQISRLMLGKIAGERVFNTAVARKTPDGQFAGMVSIALRPSYFNDFYRELLGDNSTVSLGLARADGEVLAWYPERRPTGWRLPRVRRCARRIAPARTTA